MNKYINNQSKSIYNRFEITGDFISVHAWMERKVRSEKLRRGGWCAREKFNVWIIINHFKFYQMLLPENEPMRPLKARQRHCNELVPRINAESAQNPGSKSAHVYVTRRGCIAYQNGQYRWSGTYRDYCFRSLSSQGTERRASTEKSICVSN